MVNRVWLGGGNNQASNPNDWSPTGAPQSGDNLWMPQGVMKISGLDLSADSLDLLGDDTVKLSHGSNVVATIPAGGGPATINIKGTDNLALQVGSPGGNAATAPSGTVHLAAHSQWIGSFNLVAGVGPANSASLLVNRGKGASFVDSGLSFVQGIDAHAVVDADVSGIATIQVSDGGVLEFSGSVGAGQTVLLSQPSILQIDHPSQFAGDVNLVGGEIDLQGLANADSYTYQNDMLSIFSGKSVIDTLKLTDSTPNGFAVEKTGGVNIVSITDPTNPPTGLPMHV